MENKIWNLGSKFIGKFSIFEGEIYELQENDDPMYNRFILNTIEGTPGIYCSGDTLEKVGEQINIAIDNGYIKDIPSDEKINSMREMLPYLGARFASGKNSVFKEEKYELQYKDGEYVLETIEGMKGYYASRKSYREIMEIIEDAIKSGFLEMEK